MDSSRVSETDGFAVATVAQSTASDFFITFVKKAKSPNAAVTFKSVGRATQ